MNCGEVNALLDQLMDGELSDAQRRDMQAHGQTCPECAALIRSAMQLKALFAQMDSEVDVPLPAQAAWRGAVREESKRRGRGKRLRWIASAAAAVVALVGVGMTLNLRGAPKETAGVMTETAEVMTEAAGILTEASEQAYSAGTVEESVVSNAAPIRANSADENAGFAVADGAVVEADGAFEAEAADAEEAEDGMVKLEEAPSELICAAVAQRAPACELCVHVADVETACGRIRDLVREYEGEADIQQMADGGANVYVDIDADGAGDFLSAVAPMDVSGQIGELPTLTEKGRVLVLLTIIRQEE